MELKPQLYTAKVMHKRLFPKENSFTYRVYYLALPLPSGPISGGLARFDPKDLGFRDGTDPSLWAKNILSEYGLAPHLAHSLVLITMPRVLGYVFNPVSFYLSFDNKQQLRSVIAEVHNTFGQQHSYICAHPDHSPLSSEDWLEGEKLFHVSPFLERNGHYRFRFALIENKLGIWIQYFDAEKNKQLLTSVIGTLSLLDVKSLRKAFWAHPWVSLKTILLIHWQALKLIRKGIRYISKPKQYSHKVSATHKLNKM